MVKFFGFKKLVSNEYNKVLRDATKGMVKITSLEKLLSLITHVISRKIKVSQVGILQLDDKRKSYELKASRGHEKRPVGIKLDLDSPLILWLKEKRQALVYEELIGWLKTKRLFLRKTVLRTELEEIKNQMEQLGARLCVPSFSKDRLLGALILGRKLSGEHYSEEDIELFSTLANEAAIAVENIHLYEDLNQKISEIEVLYKREHRVFVDTAIAFSAAIDAKDPYTHGHTARVTAYAMAVAEELKATPQFKNNQDLGETLRIAALLHDIGKIGVPDHILRKKGRLTKSERIQIEKHSTIGATILTPIRELSDVIDGIKYHHEWFDGSGYPQGLKGKKIPLISRIISVCDTFDAITTDRPYRGRMLDEVAIQEIKDGTGTQLDPAVVNAFLAAYEKGKIVRREVKAASVARGINESK